MFTRRKTMAMGIGTIGLGAATMAGAQFLPAPAPAVSLEEAIESFTRGAPLGEGGLTLTAPEIAENGATVPVSVEAPGAEAIRIFGPKNMQPDILTVRFGPLAGSQRLSTRIRLAESQEIIAIAQMPDGSFTRATAHVSVTIGGCVA